MIYDEGNLRILVLKWVLLLTEGQRAVFRGSMNFMNLCVNSLIPQPCFGMSRNAPPTGEETSAT